MTFVYQGPFKKDSSTGFRVINEVVLEGAFPEVQLAPLTDHLTRPYATLPAKELVREQDGRTKLLWSSDPLRKDGRG